MLRYISQGIEADTGLPDRLATIEARLDAIAVALQSNIEGGDATDATGDDISPAVNRHPAIVSTRARYLDAVAG